ncbi:hypothetical protein AB0J81_30680 [Streptomyces bobili]|uniref:hypothetical protein n=1 Tax=Streptomyces bobili TaxID=67280 RepID=UPI00342EC369
MAEETFKDGKLSGEGDYGADGQRDGPWTFYFRNGRVKAKGKVGRALMLPRSAARYLG